MYLRVKKILDFVIALVALIALSPLMAVIALLVKLSSPGPVLFKQQRVGLHRRVFTIYKFRTMRLDAPSDEATNQLKHAERYITPVGRFLRKSSLDELPQLVNILKGEMAIVGPRPVILREKKLIAERDKYGVYEVLPGLTGLAQLNGRDKVPYREKAHMDGEYVRHITFAGDLKLVLLTIGAVAHSKDVVEGAQIGPKSPNQPRGERGESQWKA